MTGSVKAFVSGLTKESFARPKKLTNRGDPAVLYALSLLLIRGIIGVIGILLPLALIVGEAFYLSGSVEVRGSISAYYHSSMRDLFVAGLCVTGFLLATYMAGQTKTRDFWWSLLAGVAVIGVAFIPTSRPGIADGAPRCGSSPMPEGCSPIQQQLGETLAAGIHYVCAAAFILALARICFLFAYREEVHKHADKLAQTLRILGWLIVAAVVWIIVGETLDISLGPLKALYLGEVIAVWAFGTAWVMKARDLRTALG